MSETDLLKKAQEYRSKHSLDTCSSGDPISVGQIRVLQHLQNFKLPSIYVLVLEIKYEKGAIRIAAIDPDIIHATPSDIILTRENLKSSFDLAVIPTLNNWAEFGQLIDGKVRGHVDPLLISRLFSKDFDTNGISTEELLEFGLKYGEIEIQPGDHSWLNRSLLIENFHEFTVNLNRIQDFSTELTTSWLYSRYLASVNSYSTLFANVPSDILMGEEDSINIDQARLIDMQIRGSMELQPA